MANANQVAIPQSRDICVVYCADCRKEFGVDHSNQSGLRLTCDENSNHIAGVIKKPPNEKHWPARDWLRAEVRIRNYVERIPKRVGFSGETGGRFGVCRMIALVVLVLLFMSVTPEGGLLQVLVATPAIIIALANVFDVLMIATYATFVSRFPAHALRTIALTLSSLTQVALAYAVAYACLRNYFCCNDILEGLWPIYFSFITIATVGYGDIHPQAFGLLQILVMTEILVGLYILTSLIAVVATWANDPPKPRPLISEFLKG